MKFIDSHCHLHNEIISNDEVKAIIEEDDSLLFCLIQGASEERNKELVDFIKTCDKAYGLVGLHPEDLQSPEENDKVIENLKTYVKNEKIVGIGEIGLDFHFRSDNKEEQLRVFEKQLKLAGELKLPVCIHCREAKVELYEILKRNKENFKHGVVIHCFSEDSDWAKKFIDLGCYLSFCGNFTFKNYDKSNIKVVPLDKLLIETDSPFLSPVPYRGQINNPTRVCVVGEAIANYLNISLEELVNQTTKNCILLYKL
ncbi:MAG: TatD family hydrolase [bacterium]|nr:TatD family hydrolase [bacterium]